MDPDWIVTWSRARAKARAKPGTTLALVVVAAQLTWSRVTRIPLCTGSVYCSLDPKRRRDRRPRAREACCSTIQALISL